MIDDHHHSLHVGKGVWHSVGSGRSQREGEGHSTEMERGLRDGSMINAVLMVYRGSTYYNEREEKKGEGERKRGKQRERERENLTTLSSPWRWWIRPLVIIPTTVAP